MIVALFALVASAIESGAGAEPSTAVPSIPFIRGESRVLEQVDAQGRPACVAAGSNEDFRRVAAAQCSGQLLGGAVSSFGAPVAQFATIISLAPDGEPLQPPPTDVGDVWSEHEVEVIVAADGRVLECTSVRRIILAEPPAIELCALLRGREHPFAPADPDALDRRARLRGGLYFKVWPEARGSVAPSGSRH